MNAISISLKSLGFPLDHRPRRATFRAANIEQRSMQMARGSNAKAPTEREPNRYVRASKILAKNDKISVKELADKAFMSERTAGACQRPL